MPPSPRIRDLNYGPGYYRPGTQNSILDIRGLRVGQKTVHDAEANVHVGVTVVYPRGTQRTRTTPCYAAIFALNGAGELTGKHFIDEWGFTNSPIAFTDSMSLGTVYQALVTQAWATSRSLGEDSETGYAHFGFPVVGETWGGNVTDIHDEKSTLTAAQIQEAFTDAETRTLVAEGSAGGGAGMLCHGFKGGTGTSSRVVPGVDMHGEAVGEGQGGGYIVAALVQTNYGQKHTLQIGGVPIGRLLLQEEADAAADTTNGTTEAPPIPSRSDGSEGSILVLLATDAPLLPHQLQRLARRATFGLAAVGGHGTSHNTSGDIFIAISTSETCAPQVILRREWEKPDAATAAGMGGNVGPLDGGQDGSVSGNGFRRPVESHGVEIVTHSAVDALFVAAGEATEEAILNALCAPGAAMEEVVGVDGTVWKGLPQRRVGELLAKWRVIV